VDKLDGQEDLKDPTSFFVLGTSASAEKELWRTRRRTGEGKEYSDCITISTFLTLGLYFKRLKD